MPIYKCNLCSKEFNKKNHLDNHLLKKKKPCINNNVLLTDNLMEKKDLSSKIPQNPSEIPQNPSKNPQNPSEIPQNCSLLNGVNLNNNIDKDDKHVCIYCNKNFNRHDNLKRHTEKYCKNKDHVDKINVLQSKINNIDVIKDEKYKKLEEDNKKLIEILEEYKHFIKENNLIKQYIPSCINNSNNIVNNNTNSTNSAINNGTVNNNTIINHIVQFGKEDISKCDLIEMMNIYLKSTGGNIFPNILKYLNFNPKFPENYNILMGDLSRENVKIHNGKKFITKKFKNVKEEILNSLSNHITNMCDTYIENPKTKKNDDILTKMKINNISIKLINNDDITPLLTIKKEKKNKNIKNKGKVNNGEKVDDEQKSANSDESDEYLDLEGEKKLVHYENKRHGLQEIATQKLKDELYNNRDRVETHHKLIKI